LKIYLNKKRIILNENKLSFNIEDQEIKRERKKKNEIRINF
jgi:hypothetical protein